jgi:hypothetical protein
MLESITLATLPTHLRQLALWLLVTLAIGYTTGLVFVAHTTSLSPTGVEERYRGNQAPEVGSGADAPDGPIEGTGDAEVEMKFEKSYAEMLNITHTHILSMASFFALVAGIFAFSSRISRRWKTVLIVEPFVAIVTSFACLWLMRYVHPAFSYLLMVSSTSMAICFYIMAGVSFVELISRKGGSRAEG